MAFDDVAERGEALVAIAKAYDEAKSKKSRDVLMRAAEYVLYSIEPEKPAKKADLVPFTKPEKQV